MRMAGGAWSGAFAAAEAAIARSRTERDALALTELGATLTSAMRCLAGEFSRSRRVCGVHPGPRPPPVRWHA